MLDIMTKETLNLYKKHENGCYGTETYNINNIHMHYPESWVEYECVTCSFSYLILQALQQSNHLSQMPWKFDLDFCRIWPLRIYHVLYVLSVLNQSCIEEGYSKDYKTGKRSKSKSLLPWVSVSWWGNTMPSVSNRGCRKATTERGSTGVGGGVWRKLIIQRNNHYHDLLALLWFLYVSNCSLTAD